MAGILVWHRMTARYAEAELKQRSFAGSPLHDDAPPPPDAGAAAREPFAFGPSGSGPRRRGSRSCCARGAPSRRSPRPRRAEPSRAAFGSRRGLRAPSHVACARRCARSSSPTCTSACAAGADVLDAAGGARRPVLAPGRRRPARPARRHARAAPRAGARRARARRAGDARDRRRARAGRRGRDRRRQPRPRARRRLAGLARPPRRARAAGARASASRRSTRRGSPSGSRAGSSPATVEVAYPGIWLRDDVYAMHGHYLDVHCAIPTLEVLGGARDGADGRRRPAAGDARRLRGRARADVRLDPGQRPARRRDRGARPAAGPAIGVWNALEGPGAPARAAPRRAARRLPRPRSPRRTAPASGPVRPELGGAAMRRAGPRRPRRGRRAPRPRARAPDLRPHPPHRHARRRRPGRVAHAVGNAAAQHRLLGLRDALHGPPARPGESPYWPGGAIALDDDGPPRLERLLGDVRRREVLSATARA